jgi:hypothetical protein
MTDIALMILVRLILFIIPIALVIRISLVLGEILPLWFSSVVFACTTWAIIEWVRYLRKNE